MRIAGVVKLGFFPAPPEAIAELVKHLRLLPPDPEKKNDVNAILDPCCGEGLAIKQIADALGVQPQHTYAVELDTGRATAARANLPGANVLGPASFLGSSITAQSFGLAYVNPPFDTEIGGGRREEQIFAQRATHLLVPRGILVLVCPFKALNGNRGFCQYLDSHFEELRVYKFPDEFRAYNEIVVIGRKRRVEIPLDSIQQHGWLHRADFQWGGYVRLESVPTLGELQPTSWTNGRPSDERELSIRIWDVPAGWKPSTFKKTAMTDEELAQALERSPLNKHLKIVAPRPPLRPPLPLDKGHLGLILASGMLDGIVEGPHGAHVVKGSSFKVEYHNKPASTSEENPETGAVTTRDVFSQRMVTVIRAVAEDGDIRTFSNEIKETSAEEEGSAD